MKGYLTLFWDNKETGHWDAYLGLENTKGEDIGRVNIEQILPKDCQDCGTKPQRTADFIKGMQYWFVPSSFLSKACKKAKGRTKDNPVNVPLPSIDFTHFQFVNHAGEVVPENVRSFVSMVAKRPEKIPDLGFVYELVGYGMEFEEVGKLLDRFNYFLGEPEHKKVKPSLRHLKLINAFLPDHWRGKKIKLNRLEPHLELIACWIRRLPKDHPDYLDSLYSTLDLNHVGIVDSVNGIINVDRVRTIRDFVLKHKSETPSHQKLMEYLDSHFVDFDTNKPKSKKLTQKMKKAKRKKGRK